MDNSQSYLDEVEADILLCEEFLARDAAGGGSEGSAPAGPSGEGEDAPGNEAQGQAPAGDSRSRAVRQRLTDDRRREILLRLVTDRRARRSPGSSAGGERPSAHNMSREERQERVQHLLAERERSLSYEYDDAVSLGQPEGDSSLALSPALQPGGGSKLADLPGAPPPGAGPYEFDPALLYTPASDGDSVTFLSDEPWHEHSTDLRAEDSLDLSSVQLVEAPPQARVPKADSAQIEQRSSSPARTRSLHRQQGGRGLPPRPASAPRARRGAPPTKASDFSFRVEERIRSSRHSKEAVAAAVEAKLASELTFQPKVNPSKGHRAQPLTLEDRIQVLAEPRSSRWEQYAKRRAEAEANAAVECSFRPKVGRPPQRRQDVAGADGGSVVERLMGSAKDRQQKRDQARAELEQAQLAECSFQPRVNDAKLNKEEYRPIHERIGDIQRAKHEKLAAARLSAQAGEDDGAGRPRINPRSAKLAARRRSMDAQQMAAALRASKSEMDLAVKEAEYTFAPRINPNSERILQQAAKEESLPESFLERQRFYQRQRLEKKQLMQQQAEDKDCTFQPAVGFNDVTLGLSRGHSVNLGESTDEMMERLTFVDRQRREHAQQARLAELQAGECTFKPSINEKSRKMARKKPLTELASNERARRAREEAERKAAEEWRQEHTFKPAIRKSAVKRTGEVPLQVAGTDPSVLLQRIAAYREEKEAKLLEARAAREEAELLECTFTPEVNQGVAPPGAPVVVRGLGRHMELQDLARRQREEQEKREAETFITNPQGHSQPFTVPKPFKLATGNPERAARAARIREDKEAAEMQECTFTPATNQRANRELIAAILGDPYSIDTSMGQL